MADIRLGDRVAFTIAGLGLVILLGTGYKVAARQQPTSPSQLQYEVRAQGWRTDDIIRRLQIIENLDSGTRIRLLEATAVTTSGDMADIKKLVVGLVVSIVLLFVATIVQIRTQRQRRQQEES